MSESLTFAMQWRMHLIDFLLAEYGTINRSALCSYFGISQPQASNDLSLYMQLAPSNMAYDATARTYRRTRDFVRVFP